MDKRGRSLFILAAPCSCSSHPMRAGYPPTKHLEQVFRPSMPTTNPPFCNLFGVLMSSLISIFDDFVQLPIDVVLTNSERALFERCLARKLERNFELEAFVVHICRCRALGYSFRTISQFLLKVHSVNASPTSIRQLLLTKSLSQSGGD